MRSRLLSPVRAGWMVMVVALAMASATAHVARADTIETDEGRVHNDVQIVDAKWDVVQFKRGESKQETKPGEAVKIERASPRLAAARALVDKGECAAAEKALDAAAAVGEEWERAEAAYRRGENYFTWSAEDPSKLDLAVAALNEYLTANRSKNDFYLPHATDLSARAAIQQGNFALARDKYKELAGYGEKSKTWKFKAKLGEGWTELRDKSGQVLKAVDLFRDVQINGPRSLQLEATVGRAAAANGQEQFDDAINTLNKSFFEAGEVPYNEVYAAALNAMGDAYFGKKELAEAELWYLRTTCWFERQPLHYRDAVRKLTEVYKGLNQADRASYWEGRLKSAKP